MSHSYMNRHPAASAPCYVAYGMWHVAFGCECGFGACSWPECGPKRGNYGRVTYAWL